MKLLKTNKVNSHRKSLIIFIILPQKVFKIFAHITLLMD
nr:MAG TPA: hypothetical protein [Bacteriophage sp.]